MPNPSLVLPRPGATPSSNSTPTIPAPSEASFVATFGALLPPASYLQTPHGRAAYYSLPPSPSASTSIARVLLVHGVQTPAIGLQPLLKSLSSQFPNTHFALLDLWGHGLSETPVAPHTPELFHELILALLKHLNWPNAHLVGYSFGGSTVASFAGRYPKLVASMALIAPAGLIPTSMLTDVQKGYLAGGNGDAALEAKAKDWIIEFLEGEGGLVVPSDWKERVARGEVVAEAVRDWEMREHPGHAASVVGVFRDGGVLDRHAVFEEVAMKGEVKGFCVLGELDGVCSVADLEAVGMHNIKVVEGVGHGVVRERAGEVAGLVGEFWKTL